MWTSLLGAGLLVGYAVLTYLTATLVDAYLGEPAGFLCFLWLCLSALFAPAVWAERDQSEVE